MSERMNMPGEEDAKRRSTTGEPLPPASGPPEPQRLRHLGEVGDLARPFVTPVAADDAAGAAFHRVTLVCIAVFAVLSVLAVFLTSAREYEHPPEVAGIPAVATAIFYGGLFGLSFAVLVAPVAYLESPAAERWLRLIGTDGPIAAKVAAFFFTILFALGAWMQITSGFARF